MSFKVISPRAEKTHVRIQQENGTGFAHHPIVLEKDLELNVGENLISLDLKNIEEGYKSNRPYKLLIEVNDILMSKYIYIE